MGARADGAQAALLGRAIVPSLELITVYKNSLHLGYVGRILSLLRRDVSIGVDALAVASPSPPSARATKRLSPRLVETELRAFAAGRASFILIVLLALVLSLSSTTKGQKSRIRPLVTTASAFIALHKCSLARVTCLTCNYARLLFQAPSLCPSVRKRAPGLRAGGRVSWLFSLLQMEIPSALSGVSPPSGPRFFTLVTGGLLLGLTVGRVLFPAALAQLDACGPAPLTFALRSAFRALRFAMAFSLGASNLVRRTLIRLLGGQIDAATIGPQQHKKR
eukprot:4769186-Pleurochrysis_carterae.AAC.5